MRSRGDRGSITVEVVLLTPLLIGAVCFVVFLGRLAQARAEIDQLAHLAASTAATARPAATATTQARTAAIGTANTGGRLCPQPIIEIDDRNLHPGGHVTVTVTCRIALTDLAPLPLPGSRIITATETDPVDLYRTGNPAP